MEYQISNDCNSSIHRPAAITNRLENGDYTAEIISCQKMAYERRDGNGAFQCLAFKLCAKDKDGRVAYLHHSLPYKWDDQQFIATLEKLDVLPEPGEQLNLKNLTGITVKVTIENQVRNGKEYSNVINMKKLHFQPEVTATPEKLNRVDMPE